MKLKLNLLLISLLVISSCYSNLSENEKRVKTKLSSELQLIPQLPKNSFNNNQILNEYLKSKYSINLSEH